MPRHSWKEIRGTAGPETLARAALKTEAMLASMDREDHRPSDHTQTLESTKEWAHTEDTEERTTP